jgi:hypothetical protein
MKRPYNKFYVWTKFLGDQISWGPNFLGTKFFGEQKSQGPNEIGTISLVAIYYYINKQYGFSL